MNTKEFPVLIGMYKVDAYKILGQRKIAYRISEEDGTRFKISGGFKPDRINLCIKNGIITNYSFY